MAHGSGRNPPRSYLCIVKGVARMLDGSSLPSPSTDRTPRAGFETVDFAHRLASSPHATYRVRLRLSVIFPFYNEGEKAGRTATAVLEFAQSNPDYHFLFVNDGSTDNTVRSSLRSSRGGRERTRRASESWTQPGQGACPTLRAGPLPRRLGLLHRRRFALLTRPSSRTRSRFSRKATS